jgi:hypothetical protein
MPTWRAASNALVTASSFGAFAIFCCLGDRDLRRIWSYKLCRDFGLLSRVHLLPDSKGTLRPRAVEIVPITGVSLLPKPFPFDEASERVEVINYLSAMLDDPASGAIGLRFAPQENGSGLYCFEGAEADPGKIGELCRRFQPPSPLTGERLARIENVCRVLTQANTARRRKIRRAC